jgi:hypothetical protein
MPYKETRIRALGGPEFADYVDFVINVSNDTIAAYADGKLEFRELGGVLIQNLGGGWAAAKDSKLIPAEVQKIGIAPLLEATILDIAEGVAFGAIPMTPKTQVAVEKTKKAAQANIECFAAWMDAASEH